MALLPPVGDKSSSGSIPTTSSSNPAKGSTSKNGSSTMAGVETRELVNVEVVGELHENAMLTSQVEEEKESRLFEVAVDGQGEVRLVTGVRALGLGRLIAASTHLLGRNEVKRSSDPISPEFRAAVGTRGFKCADMLADSDVEPVIGAVLVGVAALVLAWRRRGGGGGGLSGGRENWRDFAKSFIRLL